MTRKELPSPELLRKLLRYEPETGKLFWLERTPDMFQTWRAYRIWMARFLQKEALCRLNGRGYYQGTLYGKHIYAHRAAWAIYYGKWPDGDIDHIDGNPINNAIANLRDVTRSVNARNARMKSNNKSGFNGVFWDKYNDRWIAYIATDEGQKKLGSFQDRDSAIKERLSAEKKYGYTDRHGAS